MSSSLNSSVGALLLPALDANDDDTENDSLSLSLDSSASCRVLAALLKISESSKLDSDTVPNSLVFDAELFTDAFDVELFTEAFDAELFTEAFDAELFAEAFDVELFADAFDVELFFDDLELRLSDEFSFSITEILSIDDGSLIGNMMLLVVSLSLLGSLTAAMKLLELGFPPILDGSLTPGKKLLSAMLEGSLTPGKKLLSAMLDGSLNGGAKLVSPLAQLRGSLTGGATLVSPFILRGSLTGGAKLVSPLAQLKGSLTGGAKLLRPASISTATPSLVL